MVTPRKPTTSTAAPSQGTSHLGAERFRSVVRETLGHAVPGRDAGPRLAPLMRDVSIALFMKLSKATRASADPVSAAETERRCAWRRAASGARLRLQARPSEALSTRNQRRDDPGETDKSDAPGTIAAY